MTKVQWGFAFCLLTTLVGCKSSDNRSNQYVRRDDSTPLVDDKYSLQADRQKFAEMRHEISPEQQRENDEIAFALQMFQEVKKQPSDIRSKFDQAIRKKRDLFNSDMQKEREKFTKVERKIREDFLKMQKSERDAFLRAKPDKERRDEFFKDQDEKRKEFFANEREKRSDYESDTRERRKNFEDYAREKQNDFNQEYRIYSKRYDEWKKEQDKAKRSNGVIATPGFGFDTPPAPSPAPVVVNSEAAALEKELEELRARAGTPLESGE